MSFWSIMNWVAWGLCGLLFILIASDFIKVEKQQAMKRKEKQA